MIESDNEKLGFTTLSLERLYELYKDERYIPYAQYLRTENWKTKRIEILDRDNFRCRECNGYETKNVKNNLKTAFGTVFGLGYKTEWIDTQTIIWTDCDGNQRISELNKSNEKPEKKYNLQIHHKKYIIDTLPWNYKNEDLITLCNHCHTETHEKNKIPIYDKKGNQILGIEPCDRCAGTGQIAEYKHVQNGICFKCKGERFNKILIEKNNA